MRIAVFVFEFPKLSETFILNQITGLIDAGHQVDIFPYNRGYAEKIHEDVNRYKLLDRTYFTPNIPRNWLIRLLKALWLFVASVHHNPLALFRSLNVSKYGHKAASLLLFYQTVAIVKGNYHYDIIHCHFGIRGNEALIFKEELKAIDGQLLVSFHGVDANFGSLEERRQVYLRLFSGNVWYTANTCYTKEKLIEIGCAADRIFQIYESLRVSRFPFQPRFLMPDGKVAFLTVARLTEKKGIYYSLHAFSRLIERGVPAFYHIIGEGPLRTELEELTAQLTVADKVKFHGGLTTEEIIEVASKCQIFVLASIKTARGDSEGQGLVLQEAQAMGMPVVATRHNGIPEGVWEGKSALLVPERDIDALEQSMAYLATNSHRWIEMGRVGRKFVETTFNTSVLTQSLADVYEQILNVEQTLSFKRKK